MKTYTTIVCAECDLDSEIVRGDECHYCPECMTVEGKTKEIDEDGNEVAED